MRSILGTDAPFLSVHDVAVLLSVHVQTMRKWAREGKLASTQFGREYRFSETDVREFMRRGRNEVIGDAMAIDDDHQEAEDKGGTAMERQLA